MRPKLVDITASRDLFEVIFVPRDPCDNSEVSVLARSFVTTHLTETFFVIRWLRKPLEMDEYSVGDGKWALVRRNRTKIDLCGPKSVHDPGQVISYFVILDFQILNSVE